MEYKVTFGINGGVSPGFGVKYSDYFEKTETVILESSADAMAFAVERADYLARNSLSDPETGMTTVKVLKIEDLEGKVLSQEKTLGVNLDDGCFVARCSMIEHFLMIKSRE